MNNLDFEEFRKNVLELISSDEKGYVSFYDLTKRISEQYQLEIGEERGDEGIYVKGNNGYSIIASVFFILNELEQKHIILWVRNNTKSQQNYNIGSQVNENQCKITGDLFSCLKHNQNANIWFSPEIKWYKNHGFQTKELVAAKRQICIAQATLIIAIITMLISNFLPCLYK